MTPKSAFKANSFDNVHRPMHRTLLNYNKPLIGQAVRGFWWRIVGYRFLVALGLIAIGLTVAIRTGDTSWMVGAMGTVLLFGICFALALYAVQYRNAINKLKSMGAPQATLEASESAISLSSGAGSASLPWSAITEVWQFKTCWLLVLSKSQFVTLPLADMPPEMAAFVLARIQASGGKVA